MMSCPPPTEDAVDIDHEDGVGRDYGKLVGVSGMAIYTWEQGTTRPQKAQIVALVAVRGIGKREALVKLELLKAEAEKAARKPRKKARKKAKRK